mgnify:CR=1 FL=1
MDTSRSTENPAPPKTSGVVDSFLRSPLAGLAPWIVMAMVTGPGRFEEAASAAFGLSLVFFLAGLRRRHSIKLLEIFDLVFFGAMCIVGLIASDGVIRWMQRRSAGRPQWPSTPTSPRQDESHAS